MKRILVPLAAQVVDVNRMICERDGNNHHCYGIGKVESALYTAFYPGAPPFAAGGLACVAGALCFYLVKSHAFMDGNKRTAAISAIVFLKQNGWDVRYPYSEQTGLNALAEMVDDCAAGKLTKEQVMEWFDIHKVAL